MGRAMLGAPAEPDARERLRQHRIRVAPLDEPARADVVLDEVDRRPLAAKLRRGRPDPAEDARLVRVRGRREREDEPELEGRNREERAAHGRIMNRGPLGAAQGRLRVIPDSGVVPGRAMLRT